MGVPNRWFRMMAMPEMPPGAILKGASKTMTDAAEMTAPAVSRMSRNRTDGQLMARRFRVAFLSEQRVSSGRRGLKRPA
jgi:hypothetical protein